MWWKKGSWRIYGEPRSTLVNQTIAANHNNIYFRVDLVWKIVFLPGASSWSPHIHPKKSLCSYSYYLSPTMDMRSAKGDSSGMTIQVFTITTQSTDLSLIWILAAPSLYVPSSDSKMLPLTLAEEAGYAALGWCAGCQLLPSYTCKASAVHEFRLHLKRQWGRVKLKTRTSVA